jgi:hypothetical protein
MHTDCYPRKGKVKFNGLRFSRQHFDFDDSTLIKAVKIKSNGGREKKYRELRLLVVRALTHVKYVYTCTPELSSFK